MIKLQTKSISAAAEVLTYLKKKRIVKIHTRGAIDRMIEIAKFPYTANFKEYGYAPYREGQPMRKVSLLSGKRTAYMNKQYDNVRKTLIRAGYLTPEFDGYRYHYNVNLKKISDMKIINFDQLENYIYG